MNSERLAAEGFSATTILFAEPHDFSRLTEGMAAAAVVKLLNICTHVHGLNCRHLAKPRSPNDECLVSRLLPLWIYYQLVEERVASAPPH